MGSSDLLLIVFGLILIFVIKKIVAIFQTRKKLTGELTTMPLRGRKVLFGLSIALVAFGVVYAVQIQDIYSIVYVLIGITYSIVSLDRLYIGDNGFCFDGKLGEYKKIKGENKFLGAGVSYCATCDGAFTKGRTVSLVGKGDELIEESLFLTRYAKEVNVFLTSDDLECSEELKEAILSKENVKIVKKVKLLEIKGEDFVTELDLEVDGNKETVATDFVFLYLGTKNNLELYGEFVSLSDAGYIVTDETMKTRTDKMYAIGDIREKNIRQIATATNDGVIAASFIMKEILKAKKK